MKHLLFIIALVANLSFAQQWHTEEGNPIPDSDAQKSGKSFGALLVLTSKDKELSTNWNKPSEGVAIDTSSTVRRNEAISAFIVFNGCKEDANGNCRLVVEFTVTQPDGKLYTQTPAMEVWYEKKKPPPPALGLSVDYLKTVFEAGEQVGRYEITAKVSDLNSNESLILESWFVAEE
jgi:hypothetical protein